MTDLQIGLAAMGGVVLLGVLTYNRWITQRNQPRRSQPMSETQHEIEAGFAGGRVEPVLDDLSPEDAQVSTRAPLDALIDVLVTLAPEQPVTGDAALAAMPKSHRIGSKPFAVEGCNAETGAWEPPRPGQRYASLQAGVQLANRTGPLNDIEFSEFVAKTQALADQLAAHVDFPDMIPEVARARELDQFASDHDVKMASKIQANRAAWSPGYIVQQAERAGFLPGAIPGRMVLPATDTACGPLVVLQFEQHAAFEEDPDQGALMEFDLLFDVPQVKRSEYPYARLREAARVLTASMEGRLTDERGVPLADSALDQVGAQLERLYDMLESREIAAGSPLARRLFS